jgi:hypothetical protein
MKHLLSKLFGLTMFSIFITSCQDDNVVVNERKYQNGIIVVNQGVFQSGTGTISFISNETKSVTQNVFGIENANEPLGNIAQSIIKFGNQYFIAVNNANKVVVTDLNFKKKGVISGVELPRYFAISSNKLYLSAWGADFVSGRIHQIDTTSLSISNTINVGNAPEQMLNVGNQLYVTISSPYGGDSEEVAVINTATNTIESRIKTADSPTAIARDKDGNIWVLCTGNYAFNPANNTPGALVKISNGIVTQNLPLPNGTSSLVTNKDGSKLYYISAGGLFGQDFKSSTLTNERVLEGSFNAVSFDSKTNSIIVADAKDFQTSGEIKQLNLSNNQTSTFTSGIIPGFIYPID